METFWARLKTEIAWIRGSIHFDSRAAAHGYLFEFIEIFDNRQRHQQAIGRLTPPSTLTAGVEPSKPESHRTPCPSFRANISSPRRANMDRAAM